MEDLRKARSLTEEHYQSLQTVIQHIGIGLISFRPDGEVGLMNAAAKKILRTHQLANITSLASLSPDLVTKLFRLKSGDRVLVKIDREAESAPARHRRDGVPACRSSLYTHFDSEHRFGTR